MKTHDEDQLLVCSRCGVVLKVELPSATMTALQEAAAQHGFTWTRGRMKIHGLCEPCDTEIKKREQIPSGQP